MPSVLLINNMLRSSSRGKEYNQFIHNSTNENCNKRIEMKKKKNRCKVNSIHGQWKISINR